MRRREEGDDEQFTWRVWGEGKINIGLKEHFFLTYAQFFGWNYVCNWTFLETL